MVERASMPHEVPAYNIDELAPRRHAYALIIPVINEGARIRAQLERMQGLDLQADIIIADGGSRDGSVMPDFLRAMGVRSLLTKTGPGKLSAQLRMGFDYGLQQGYEGFVTIDGNNKDGVEAVPAFVAALREGYGFVQGSRSIAGGAAVNTPLDRAIGVALIHAPLISLAARYRYTDTTNGFRAFSRDFLTDARVQPFRDIFDTYNLHYYLSVKAPRLGYRVKELPVTRTYPANQPPPSKIGGVAGKLHIVKQLLLTVAGAYDPA